MANLELVQRVTVYAADGTTVLTPIAGAAHSDPFRIATHRGVAGYQPYLYPITGRKGKLEPLKKTLDASTIRVTFLDQRTTAGGDQAERWGTAFLGDTNGVGRLLGCKVVLEESTTGAAGTFTAVFTGRVVDVETDGAGTLLLGLTVRDLPRTLGKAECFVGRPHDDVLDYAVNGRHWPLGLPQPWGSFQLTPTISGTLETDSALGRIVKITDRDLASPYNFLTDWLRAQDVGFGWTTDLLTRGLTRAMLHTGEWLRLRVSGGATGVLAVRGFLCRWKGSSIDGMNGWHVRGIVVEAVRSTERDYVAVPADGATVTVQIETPWSRPSEACPLYIDDVHPAQLAKDILNGYFGTLERNGNVIVSYPYDATALDALIADTSIPTGRWRITRSWKVMDFLEQQICQPYNLGMRVDAQGRLVFFDMRLPSSTAALPQLTSADLAQGPIRWGHSAQGAISQINVVYGADRQISLEEVGLTSGAVQANDSQLLRSTDDFRYEDPDFGRSDLGGEVFEFKALGFRESGHTTAAGIHSVERAKGLVLAAAEHYRHPFAGGPEQFSGKFRRTAAVDQVRIGDWVLVDLPQRPNTQTNERGGQRLALCTARNDLGLFRELTFLDAGPTVQCVPPVVGTIAQEAGNTRHGVTVPITINAAGDRVEVEYAVTDGTVATVGAVPADRWTRWRTYASGAAGAVVSVTINPLPAGRRIWLRARSINATPGVKRLPSAWAHSTGTDYVTTASLTAPSALAATDVSTAGCTLTWTNGDSTLRTQLWVRSPAGSGTWSRMAMAEPGSDIYFVGGFTAAATYEFRVQHLDGAGGESSYSSTVSVTASGTPPTCPAAGGLSWEDGIR